MTPCAGPSASSGALRSSPGSSSTSARGGGQGLSRLKRGLPSAGGVQLERRWPGASSFLKSKISTKFVVNRGTEKPVLSGKNWNDSIRYIR